MTTEEEVAMEPVREEAPGPKKLFRLVYKFLLLSLVVHLVGLAVFGGITVLRKLKVEEVTFVAPPPTIRVEPKKRQYKLRAEQQRKRSSRPVLQPRIQSSRMSEVALPAIQSKVAPIKQKAVKLPGVSEGFGDGLAFGGGTGMGNIFGVKIHAEKLGVLLDVSYSTHGTIHLAVKEIQKSFPNAIIVLAPGCGMQASRNQARVISGKELAQKRKSLKSTKGGIDLIGFLFDGRKSGKKNLAPLLKKNEQFKALYDDLLLDDALFAIYVPPVNGNGLSGTHLGFDFLMDEGVDAIYWFADFVDKIEPEIAKRLVNDLKQKRIPVYQQVLGDKAQKDALIFAQKTGGKIIRPKD